MFENYLVTVLVTAQDGVTRKTYTISAHYLTQQAYIKSSNTGTSDGFGYSGSLNIELSTTAGRMLGARERGYLGILLGEATDCRAIQQAATAQAPGWAMTAEGRREQRS